METTEPVWITGVGAATPLGCELRGDRGEPAGRAVGCLAGDPVSDRTTIPAGSPRSSVSLCAREAATSIDFAARPAARSACPLVRRVGPARRGSVGASSRGTRWAWCWASVPSGCCTGRPIVISGGTRLYDPDQDRDSTIERVHRELGLSGPALALSAACASGNHALEIGRHWLRLGLVDVCVAGACDLAVSPIGLATFGNLRALSRRNDDPAAASRPFDRGRDGFVLGEGGVAFVLERAACARRRGANAYAEVAGCGSSSDAHHHVIPSPDPAPAAAAMRQALADAQIEPGEVDHVNAHATSTPVGDAAEAAVLRLVLGDDAGRIPVTSTKSLTGHMLTAAGAFEALACLTAMRHQAIPPTINLDEPDVDLCLVANEARPHPVRIARVELVRLRRQ